MSAHYVLVARPLPTDGVLEVMNGCCFYLTHTLRCRSFHAVFTKFSRTFRAPFNPCVHLSTSCRVHGPSRLVFCHSRQGYPNPEGYVHVRTIIGIVLGLSVTRLFTGLARFVQHPGRVAIYPVHLAWVFFILIVWMVQRYSILS